MNRETPFLRRGRSLVKRRRRPRSRTILLVAAAAALSVVGLLRFLGGSLFALDRFDISGNVHTRTEEILGALAPWRSRNLVTLNLAPAAASLARLPWVERVTLSKRFPDGLSVRIAERHPVALLKEEGLLLWLDREGHAIAPYDPRSEPGDAVLASGDRRALPDLVGLLEDLREREPEYFSVLSEISALPEGGFGMMDSIFRRPIRVLRRDAPEKIAALLKARSFIEKRGWEARAIDLRFADRIVLEGAYGAGNSL